MSYTPTTDFLALLRLTSGGVRTERMSGLDWLVSAMARAGLFLISVSDTAPLSNQTTTAWFRPASPSWALEGALFLWNATTIQYEPATPTLFAALLTAVSPKVIQDVAVAGPTNVQTNASILRVMNVGAPVTLVMPLASLKTADCLLTDWANHAGTNPITINLTAPDTFPNGVTSWQIGGDGGSVFLRSVPGGYAL